MEDESPRPNGQPQDGVTTADQVAMATSLDEGIKQEVTADTHDMLRKVAQDAASQAEDAAARSVHQQKTESNLDGVEEPAHVDRQTTAGANGANGLGINGAEDLHGPDPQRRPFEAHCMYTNHDYSGHAGLPNGSSDLTHANIEALIDDPTLEAAASVVESETPRIQAFAKLEFDDGEFYMNTYSVELGRDIRAARQAYERDVQALQQVNAKLLKRSSSSGDISHSSSRVKSEHGRHLSGSVISESGGIMGLDHSDSDSPRQRKGKKSKSGTSSSQQLSRKSSMNFPGLRTDYQSLAMASLLGPSTDAQLVDPRNSMPSPESCPLVPIHPPASTDGVPTSHKSISRKHVKIAFNFEKHLFEVIILGRNGAFVDEEWYPEGDVQPLRSGSLIQIGGVGIRFLLPDVALGETGAENTQSSDPASFEVDDGRNGYRDIEDSSDDGRDEQDEDENESEEDSNDKESDESEEPSEEETRGRSRRSGREVKPTPANRPVRNRKPVRGKEPMKTTEPAKAKQPAKARLKLTTRKEPDPEPDAVTPPPKRKGPGRPPKNGIISKREQALLARQAKEAAKAAAQSGSAAPPARGKGKSIPPPAEANQENGHLQPTGKRKYKKRKTKAEIEAEAAREQQGVRESTEHTDSVPPDQNAAIPPKPSKPMRPPKPPRSPSPVFDESTLTPEQLAKPQSSYVVLIHEALSNSQTGQMSLPQIYRAIERKYPFYKLRVQTTGWQSSVRHNLSQHPAFRKIERDGKGWMWGLVPEVSIEKEKKRRMTPPPMSAGGYYPSPQMMQPPYPYPNPHMSYPPYASYPGLPRPYPPPSHFPTQQTASSLPPALANAQVDTSSTYQSPYATGPAQQPSATSEPQQPTSNGQKAPSPTPMPAINSSVPASSTPNPPQPPPSSSSHPQTNTINPVPTPTPAPPSATQHTPDVLAVVKKFKDFLLSSMSDNPKAEQLINSAIGKVLSPTPSTSTSSTENTIPPQSSNGENNDHQEKAIMKILQGMLDNMRAKAKGEGDCNNGGGGGAGKRGEGGGGGGGGNTFFQILESVSRRGDDGALPMPLPPTGHHLGAGELKSPSQPRVGTSWKVEGADPEEVGAVPVGGEGDEMREKEEEEAPADERKATRKRPLDTSSGDYGDDADVMGARPSAAKRVAT
ncbi:MAG: hypothetical protein LQ338_006150 [Usnochroma carphineum]|nr:MAG: hypothetical protein LQ338_006150 [Usnochroma carphineum]